MGPSVEGNHGDDHAFRVAAVLVNDFALPDSVAWELLLEWNTTCSPPWPERDLRRFIASGSKNAKRPAGSLLEVEMPTRHSTPAQVTPVAPAKPRAGIPLVRAGDVKDEKVEWLIPGFVARRELTDLSGDPGVGKGGILASWAAHVTTNSDEGVILFSTEDRLGHVKARLRSEGADLNRVLLLDIREANSNPILPGDIDLVERAVREYRASLVAFDPALEFMGADLDSHKQQDVQLFAASLGNLAHRTGSAILTVRHNNKAQGVAAIYRSAGSIAFIARARMALMANKDKENGGRVLSVVKGNIGKDSSAVTFDIVEKDGSTVIAWGQSTTITADELVNQDPKKKRGRPGVKTESAVDLLKDMLTDGPMKTADILRGAKTEGVSRTQVYEARKVLKLESCTIDLHSGWRLPE
jgi:putative DNA primase/helicase